MITEDREYPDYCRNMQASRKLVANILKYWRDRGQNPQVDIKTERVYKTDEILYVVRSNIDVTWPTHIKAPRRVPRQED